MLNTNKNTITIQVGLQKNNLDWDLLWFDEKKQPHFLTLSELDLVEIHRAMSESLDLEKQNIICRFITALHPQHIWTKTLILPHGINSQEAEQQCKFILQNEVPIPLDDLWCDYSTTAIKQGIRFEVFAVKKTVAQESMLQCSPLTLNVLDVTTNSIIRGFCYLQKQTLFEQLLLYRDENFCFAIQENMQQNRILTQTSQNLTALFQQFCQIYKEEPQQVVVYSKTPIKEKLPEHWRVIHTTLPVVALGNALWKQELFQQESYSESTQEAV